MISPISIATRGRIAPTSSVRTLTLATIGWLVGAALFTPHDPIYPVNPSDRFDSNVGGITLVSPKITLSLQERLIREDEDLILIIHAFLRSIG